MSHHIATANKPFTIGEELILPAYTGICSEVLGESAAKKIAQVPLSARTVARRFEDLATDIESQLLKRLVKSPWLVKKPRNRSDVRDTLPVLLSSIIPSRERLVAASQVHGSH